MLIDETMKPQTAAQHNAPHVGQHSFTPSKPVERRKLEPLEALPASWNLRELKDTRENVVKTIEQSASVPEACRAMLIAAINESHGHAKLIRLDAHCQIVKTAKGIKHLGTWDISEL